MIWFFSGSPVDMDDEISAQALMQVKVSFFSHHISDFANLNNQAVMLNMLKGFSSQRTMQRQA